VDVCPGEGSTPVLTESGRVWVAGFTGLDGKHPGPDSGVCPVRRVEGFPNDFRVVQVSSGGLHWLALGSGGQVWAWGRGEDGALGDDVVMDRERPRPVRGFPLGMQVVQVSAGARHSVALASGGSVGAWGSNENGELGIPLRHEWRQHPAKVRWTE
jgi:alpha-tubulin suppressor-like RCC1 family protein